MRRTSAPDRPLCHAATATPLHRRPARHTEGMYRHSPTTQQASGSKGRVALHAPRVSEQKRKLLNNADVKAVQALECSVAMAQAVNMGCQTADGCSTP